MKRRERLSAAYLGWVRTLPCYFGTAACGPVEAHHFRPKGRLGYTDDLATIPVCQAEHKRCHGQVVQEYCGQRLQPIAEAVQHTAVLVTFWRFWQEAPAAVKRAVFDDIMQRDERPGWVPA